MPAPIVAAVGKVSAKLTAKVIAKKMASVACRSAADFLTKKESHARQIIVGGIIVFSLVATLFVIMVFSVPMPLAGAQTVPDVKSKIDLYVQLQNRIDHFAKTIAEQKAREEVARIKTELARAAQMTTPSAVPLQASAASTPVPTPKPISFDTEIDVTTPTWRVLMALDSVHNSQNANMTSVPYIEDFVKDRISCYVESVYESSDTRDLYSIIADAYCGSTLDLAMEIETTDPGLSDNEKTIMVQSIFRYLCYINDQGTQLSAPMNDGTSLYTPLSAHEIAEIKKSLPADLSPKRVDAVLAGYSIVGKVDYFWGGKSRAMGWDERWGRATKVTSPGSWATGMTFPFGLDCSGFVGWCWVNGTSDTKTLNITGSSSSKMWMNCSPVDWDEGLPGDVVFYHPPNGKPNHVGLIVGKDDKGHYIVIHSPQTGSKVSITEATRSGFHYIRRPPIFETGEKR